ncbi:MAG: protein kinase [Anaerolineae bacterium]
MFNLIGQSLGQYILIEPIDSGGMSTVYKAHQATLDRTVAVKVLPEYLLAQPDFLNRFKIEAQAIAHLDHPHILPVYDYGQSQGVPYLVMKYVSGGTLRDRMRGGPMEPREAGRILRQIAEALAHAHQQGVIHRDVKPSNILLQDGQWVQLMDFGLAKIVQSQTHLTASGVGVGTPDYMSPEQAQGQPVDARSDIYSLGVVLYQMLTGELPFKAETSLAVMMKHVTEEPPPLRSLKPDISESTEQVVLRALAKAPAERYATALELADAFDRALDSGATRLTVPALARSERSRSGSVIGLGVIAVVVIAALAFALIRLTATPNRPAGSIGAVLLDDFGSAAIDARWQYRGSFTTILNSPAVSIKSGRLNYDVQNSASEYYDGGLWLKFDRPVAFVSARVTLQDASGFGDIGLQVNGLSDQSNAWTYLSLTPSDGTAVAYLGHDITGTEETYTLLTGTGMPATRELAISWDGTQVTFYVDGQARKSLATKALGQWVWLVFDVEPNGRISGSFDDVRVTYADK